jgi:hypothetical protein
MVVSEVVGGDANNSPGRIRQREQRISAIKEAIYISLRIFPEASGTFALNLPYIRYLRTCGFKLEPACIKSISYNSFPKAFELRHHTFE